MHDKLAELIENEVGVLRSLLIKLLLCAFHEALELAIELSKAHLEGFSTCFDSQFARFLLCFIVLELFFLLLGS